LGGAAGGEHPPALQSMPRIAFITGASYGIGQACALALARDGFHVAVSELLDGGLTSY